MGLAAVIVLLFAGVLAYPHMAGNGPSPLALPKLSAADAGAGSATIDGTWTAGSGSQAGYRVREVFFGQGNSVVGRTSAVTGKVVITGTDVSSASFRVDLATMAASGKKQPQLAHSLDTARFPDATLTLTKPIVVGSSVPINKTFSMKATGLLAMHGITHPVTFEITARYSGSRLEAAGSIPVLFSDWKIQAPSFTSYLAIQNQGLVEFLVILSR